MYLAHVVSYPSIRNQHHDSSRDRWRAIVFKADTKEGRRFDVILLWAILASVLTVMAESVPSLQRQYGSIISWAEYAFTCLFTVEYVTRVYLSRPARSYILSFWGIVDLMATIPTYLSLLFPGPQYLLMVRSLRLLRVFRVFRLTSYMIEAQSLLRSLSKSGAKIIVFFVFVLLVVVVMGTLMYIIEPREAGFQSIPQSIYWAIVTLTTVGYGDITPITPLGQFLSAALMILGYAVIAVPTGIVSVEVARAKNWKECERCHALSDDSPTTRFCSQCGHPFSSGEADARIGSDPGDHPSR